MKLNSDGHNNLTSKMSHRSILCVGIAVIGALFIDMIASTFFDLYNSALVSEWGFMLFVIISAITYGGGLYLLFRVGRLLSRNLAISKILYKLYKLAVIIHCGVAVTLTIIILQMMINSKYVVELTMIGYTISSIPFCIFSGFLGFRFFSWYKSNKRNFMLLLFGLSSTFATIAAGANIVVLDNLLSERPEMINQQSHVDFNRLSSSSSSTVNQLFIWVVDLMTVSFLFEWGGITLLLQNFAKKIGKIKFWIIMILPLISVLIGILPTSLASSSSHFVFYDKEFLFYRIATTVGSTGGAFLMGFAYVIVSRSINKIHHNVGVTSYMIVSGLGVVMIALALLSPIMYSTYPPFGEVAHNFMAGSSFLFSIGIYLSAISVSNDINLRKMIRKFALTESKFLDSIGTAHMEQEIQSRVIKITKEKSGMMEKETGVESSLNEDDIKDYFNQVLQEIKKDKNMQLKE